MNSREMQSKISELITHEQPNFLQFLRRKFHSLSEMDLEDLLSDFLLYILDRDCIAAPIDNLTAYIYRSLYHRGLDFIKRRRQTVSMDQHPEPDKPSLADTLADPGQDLPNLVIESELHHCLLEILAKIEPRQRNVWIATELEGYSFKELAKQWNEPIGTLLARKHRASKKIAELFETLKLR